MTDQKNSCSGAAFGNLVIALFLLALVLVLIIHPVSAIESDWCIVGGFEEESSCTMYEYCTGTSGYNWTCPDSNNGCQWVDHYTLYNPDWAIMTGDDSVIYPSDCAYGDCNLVFFNSSESACVTPTPTPDIGECHQICGYSIDNHCITIWTDIAAALSLASGGVCNGFWQYAANDCPCQEGQPNVTYTPTPTPTPTPIIPVPTTHTIMPTPMVTQRYVIHPTPVAYTSMAPVTTMATLPTLPPTLFNDTYLYNQTVNSSPLSKGMIDMGVAVGDMIHYVTYPIVSMVLSPLLSMITASSDTLNQAVSMYSFFAQFPFLFLYAGVVTVSYLPNKVMFLIAFVLWVNLLFRSYDFLKAR